MNKTETRYMKKVTLLGDSIRLIGYGTKVPELLGDGYTVFQPTDNCRFAQYLLRCVFDYKNEIAGSDVVHYNAGLWDATFLFSDKKSFTPVEDYCKTLLRVTDELKKLCPRLIFATTTPCRTDMPYNDNGIIKSYNDAIVPLLKERGVEINDLNALVSKDIIGYIRDDDKIHLTEKGIEDCSRQVVKAIKGKL